MSLSSTRHFPERHLFPHDTLVLSVSLVCLVSPLYLMFSHNLCQSHSPPSCCQNFYQQAGKPLIHFFLFFHADQITIQATWGTISFYVFQNVWKWLESDTHANGILSAKRQAVFSRIDSFFHGCSRCFEMLMWGPPFHFLGLSTSLTRWQKSQPPFSYSFISIWSLRTKYLTTRRDLKLSCHRTPF